MSLARTSYPPRMLSALDTRSQAPCVAELGLQLGANLTTHKGHASGGVLIGTTPNPAPLNPSGEHGHDHSGGEYGRPRFISIATLDFGGGAYESGLTDFLAGPRAYKTEHGAVPADVPTLVGGGTFRLWIPPCDRAHGVGAYAALGIMGAIEIEATALRAADVVTLELVQATPGASGAVASVICTGDPSSTGWLAVLSGSDALLPTVPGKMNAFYWHTKIDRENAGSSRGAELRLDSLELGVFST